MRDFLSDCKRIEEIAGNLYQRLAVDRNYTKEVREVFQKLSDDEKEHARHIDLVLQADKSEISVTHMIPEKKLDEALMKAKFLAQKAGQEEMNEEKALLLAVHMEEEFAKVHIHNALFFENRKLADLFDKLGKEDEAHLNTLKDCLKWWDAKRKQVLNDN